MKRGRIEIPLNDTKDFEIFPDENIFATLRLPENVRFDNLYIQITP